MRGRRAVWARLPRVVAPETTQRAARMSRRLIRSPCRIRSGQPYPSPNRCDENSSIKGLLGRDLTRSTAGTRPTRCHENQDFCTTCCVLTALVEKGSRRGFEDATGALLDWVERDPRHEVIFWKDIWPKLLAIGVEGPDDKPILHRIEKIIVSERNRDDPLSPYEPPSLDDVGFRIVEKVRDQ